MQFASTCKAGDYQLIIRDTASYIDQQKPPWCMELSPLRRRDWNRLGEFCIVAEFKPGMDRPKEKTAMALIAMATHTRA